MDGAPVSLTEISEESGVDLGLVSRLQQLDLLIDDGDGFTPADVGRIRVMAGLQPRASQSRSWPVPSRKDSSPFPGSRASSSRLRHVDANNMQMLIQMAEIALESASVAVRKKDAPPAIVFADLSGYTSRTDEAGARRLRRRRRDSPELVRVGAGPHDGAVVKFLGDWVMVRFSTSIEAVRFAVDLVREAASNGLPPARAGIDAGPLVFREGD